MDEKATIADNIHKCLTRISGVWITPDADTKRSFEQLRTMKGGQTTLDKAYK
jgi:hypothetical protein